MHKPLIVVTDLDGTLLDHHSYRYDAALPALGELERRGIPLVLNSSKTAAEMLALRAALGNREPFIVENGAGIYAPGEGEDLEKIEFGMKRAAILDICRRLRRERHWRFLGFADMNEEELRRRTDLSPPQAARALRRDFTEPLLWQDTEENLAAFREALRQEGVATLQGGRFVHLSGPVDKGMALDWLKRWYTDRLGAAPAVIALGDSDNDRAMLERADYPVLVRSPVNGPPRIDHPRLRCTQQEGPAGWNAAVLDLLKELDK